MRVYNRYVLALGIAFSLATILMALWGVAGISAYFTAYAIIYLALTALFIHFNPRAMKALDTVGIVVFAGFMSVVMLKAVEILRRHG